MESIKGMRAAIYGRFSSDMQRDGFSMEAQLAACRKLAEERGWEVVAIYTDEAKSGKTTARPDFRKMLRDAQNEYFDVLLVHKLDRFSRSVVDVLTTCRTLDEVDVALVSVMEQFDFSTPLGRMMLTMLAALAQWYLDNLSAETSKGKEARAKSGLWNGDVPFGYTVDYKNAGGDGQAYPDEDDRDGTVYMFEQYALGIYSDNDVAQLLNEAGYRPQGRGDRALQLFSKDSVRDMLKNRFYVGEVQYKGEWYPGVHEAIISEELFERCQEVRRQRAPKRGTTARKGSRVYPLTGVAYCARCGEGLRGSYTGGRRYYRDPARQKGRDCDQRMVRAEEAEGALGSFLRQLALPQDWREIVLAQIEEQLGKKDQQARERAKIEKRLKRLKRLFVLGDLEEDVYVKKRDEMKAELKALTPVEMPDLECAASILQDLGTIWAQANLKERRQIVHTLLKAVYLDSGDRGPVLAIEPEVDFAPLFEIVEPGDEGVMILEPGANLVGLCQIGSDEA
jgi:site-specific DNA recombinase